MSKLYKQLQDLLGVANYNNYCEAHSFLKKQIQHLYPPKAVDISHCETCEHKLYQPDLLDANKSCVCGCKLLTQKQWNKGLVNNQQTKCPIQE